MHFLHFLTVTISYAVYTCNYKVIRNKGDYFLAYFFCYVIPYSENYTWHEISLSKYFYRVEFGLIPTFIGNVSPMQASRGT